MATLGCATTRVVVQRRGGIATSQQPSASGGTSGASAHNWSTVEWNRIVDDTSGCQVRVEGRARCCDWASKVKPWRDEIAVWRGNRLVWCGPVTEVVFTSDDELRLDCKDRSQWLHRRAIHNLMVFGQGTELSTVFNAVVADAMSVDASPNLTVAATPSGVVIDEAGGRTYTAWTQYASDVINELSRTGVDWTVLNDKMIVGGSVIPDPSAKVPTFVAKHFMDALEVDIEGNDYGSRIHVIGAGGGDAGATVIGHAGGPSALETETGVVEMIFTEPNIRDNNSALANAQTRFNLYGRDGIPTYVNGGKLSRLAPVDINALIPGTVFKVALGNCPPANALVRLTSVTGSVGPEHDDVTVNFEPIGGPARG